MKDAKHSKSDKKPSPDILDEARLDEVAGGLNPQPLPPRSDPPRRGTY